jgi:hypothetical protein
MATIVLDIESGTGFEAGNVNDLVRAHFDNVITMTDYMRKPGTKTDEAAKREMMMMTREQLRMGEIFIHEQFVTTHPDKEKLLKEFSDQMCEYTKVISDSTNNRRASTVTYTGKTKAGKKDDLSVTLQRCIRAMDRFVDSAKYGKYRI